ncbi:vesicle-mediated transport [Cyanidiococcus yangmingshanensis]|uniref:Vesicle-mediated transport n=1 Tax=Cyanidiococcus yangmingshanensis TaxID=2690220 RepID=A0A7J7IGT7_9RHOD|nr:vesicle-mediated transport [Cyanidiococcus yangmingshanensis]
MVPNMSARRFKRRIFSSCFLLLGLLLCLEPSWALQFYIKSGQKKCFSEDVTASTRVLGEYLVTAGPGKLEVDLTVTGPEGKMIFHKENIDQGKFTFESPAGPQHGQRAGGHEAAGEHGAEHREYDENYEDVWPTYNYQFCLMARNGDGPETKRKVTLHVSAGAAAKDYSTVAKVEHLDNLEVALRRMEDEVRTILEELEHMRAREEAMRSINEAVSRRVLWYSIISCLVMIGAGVWQARYLNAFFRAKKLI